MHLLPHAPALSDSTSGAVCPCLFCRIASLRGQMLARGELPPLGDTLPPPPQLQLARAQALDIKPLSPCLLWSLENNWQVPGQIIAIVQVGV